MVRAGIIAYQSASSGSEERSDSEKTQHFILLAGSVASLVVGFFLLRS